MAKFPRFNPGETFGLRGPRGTLVLDRRAAEILNLAAREMTRLGNVAVDAPLRWEESTSGRMFACDRNPEIMAKLSGAGEPYSFVQQQYDPATNTWSDMAGGRAGDNCYESRGLSGLAGKIVLISYVPSAGDWRFQWVGYGPPPCYTSPFCINDLPDTCTTGDDMGTVTLTRIAPGVPTWQSDILDYPVTTYEFDSGSSGPCHETGEIGTVRYVFSVTCVTSGPDNGKLRGMLQKLFWGRCCGTSPTYQPQAGIGTPTIVRPESTGVGVFACGEMACDIDFPPDAAICPPSTLTMPNPGGGGIIPVMF